MTSTTTDLTRPDRTYTVHYREECGVKDAEQIEIESGTKDEQDAAAWVKARAFTIEWVRDGDYSADGAAVEAWYYIEDDDYTWEMSERRITVDIEPDHESLIEQATDGEGCGTQVDAHDWTSEGEGGCRENPGVWSTGGTGMKFRDHCRRCGLTRTTYTTGSQRNPDDHDTVVYEMPDAEQIAIYIRSGSMDGEE